MSYSSWDTPFARRSRSRRGNWVGRTHQYGPEAPKPTTQTDLPHPHLGREVTWLAGGWVYKLFGDGNVWVPVSGNGPNLTDWDNRPTDPIDGMETVLEVQANDIRWRMRYDSGDDDWKFVGGQTMWAEVNIDQTTTSTSATDLGTTGPLLTTIAAGVYRVDVASRAYGTASAQACIVYFYDGTTHTQMIDHYTGNGNTYNPSVASFNRTWRRFTLPDAAATKLTYSTNTGTAHFSSRKLTLLPEHLDN